MLRFLLWLVLGMIALFRLKSAFGLPKGPRPEKQVKPPPPEKAKYNDAGEMVEDPVCGAYVEADSSVYLIHEERKFHFCSEACKRKFLAEIRR